MLPSIKPLKILFYKTPKLSQSLLADTTCPAFLDMDIQIWIVTPNNNFCEHMWMWIKSTSLHSITSLIIENRMLFAMFHAVFCDSLLWGASASIERHAWHCFREKWLVEETLCKNLYSESHTHQSISLCRS